MLDETWVERRKNSVFVGVTYEPDAGHFADSVGIPTRMKDGFDVFLTRFDDHYRVEALTDKGKDIVAAIKDTLVDCDCPGRPRGALQEQAQAVRGRHPGDFPWRVQPPRMEGNGPEVPFLRNVQHLLPHLLLLRRG